MNEQYDDLYNSINKEIEKLDKNLNSISIGKIINIMGFPMNSEQKNEYNNNERYLENF